MDAFTFCLVFTCTDWIIGTCLKESDKEQGHQKTITSLPKSVDLSHFLTGSLDKSAKVMYCSIC